MNARCLHEESSGAAMVFGIFFAVFLCGMIWYVLGLAQTLDYRQEIQDASDAAAFSAAVVNARGMNLLALINMTMAAILSVLVGLRLAQTVGYVAIGVCVSLASPTMGTSLSPIPAITSAVTQIGKIASKVEDALPRVLGALHSAGKAVSVVVPVGANLRVIDMVAHEYEKAEAGVAIPSRFTLPVQDDDFGVLCSHAGELSGAIAMLPFSPILPERIERELSDVSGKIASAGSEWFCGNEGAPPDLNRDQDSEPTAVEKTDVLESLERNKQEGGPNTSPFRLEEGAWLGGSDFQLRAVVFGVELDSSAQAVMELATWGKGARHDSAASVSQAASAVAHGLGRIGLSQAEYYFDWNGLNPQPNDQRRAEDVTEWLWHMGWRARLRPFRFSQEQADGPRPEKSGPDSEQKALLPESLPPPHELECAGKTGCDEAQQVIDIFGDGES